MKHKTKSLKNSKTDIVTKTLIDNIIKKIVSDVHPLKIIIFGSIALGTNKKGSDLDLLIVMPDGINRRETAMRIYTVLGAVGIAKDIVVVTESDLRKYGSNPSMIIAPAIKEGKVIYSASK